MENILRVDLSKNNNWIDYLDKETYRKYVGGVGLGVKFLNIKLYIYLEGSWEKPTWLI